MEFSKKDLYFEDNEEVIKACLSYPRSEAELIKQLRMQLVEKVKIIDDLQDIILNMSKKQFKKQVIEVRVKKVTDNIPVLEPLKQFKLRPQGLPSDVLRVKPNNELISDANFETLIKDLQFDW